MRKKKKVPKKHKVSKFLSTLKERSERTRKAKRKVKRERRRNVGTNEVEASINELKSEAIAEEEVRWDEARINEPQIGSNSPLVG